MWAFASTIFLLHSVCNVFFGRSSREVFLSFPSLISSLLSKSKNGKQTFLYQRMNTQIERITFLIQMTFPVLPSFSPSLNWRVTFPTWANTFAREYRFLLISLSTSLLSPLLVRDPLDRNSRYDDISDRRLSFLSIEKTTKPCHLHTSGKDSISQKRASLSQSWREWRIRRKEKEPMWCLWWLIEVPMLSVSFFRVLPFCGQKRREPLNQLPLTHDSR